MPDTYSQLWVHLIFTTKQRQPLISAALEPKLFRYIGGIVEGQNGRLAAIGGIPDHIHLLIGYRPAHSVADLAMHIKGSSSRWVNLELPQPSTFAWQVGYGAFSVSSSNLQATTRYILDQPRHHASRSLGEEWAMLKQRHDALDPG